MRTVLVIAALAASATAAEFTPNHLFIARYGDGILEYDLEGNHVASHGPVGAASVEFGPDGHMFVTTGNGVTEIDAEGNTVRTFGHGSLGFAIDTDFGPGGQLFVADFNGDQVLVFDRDGTFDRLIGDATSLDGAAGIRIAPNGHLWVSSQNVQELVEFDPDGTVVRVIDDAFVGQASEMVFGPDGMLYLANGAKILRIDPETGALTNSMDYANAAGITVGPDGHFRVTDDTGFVDVVSHDSIGGFQSLDRSALAGSSTTGGVACGPFRFSLKVKGRFVDPQLSHGVKENATLTYVPGGNAIFVDFGESSSFGLSFVGRGVDNLDQNGKWRWMLGVEMSVAPTVFGTTALSIGVKGKTVDGLFFAKSASGTLHRTQGTTSVEASLKSKKKLQ